MTDAKTCINDAQEKMDMAVMYLEEALAHIRAGKASTRLLDGIRVDSYGSMVPISNVAAVTTPDARSIAHQAMGQEYVPHHRKSNYGFRTRYHSRK